MRAQRRITLKIKPSLRRLRQRFPKLPFANLTNRKPRTRLKPLQNQLPRNPISLRKHRPQALVPLNNVPKRSFQRANIKQTLQPYRQRDRVARSPTFQPLNQQRNRRRFKQAADRYLNIKARPQPADQTRRQKRVTPKREEVNLNPNALDPQYLRKQTAQYLLSRRARRPKTTPTNHRRRQRCSVKLPVRRQRKTGKLHNRRRHHVVRKPRTNMRAQLPSINRTPSRRYHIAHKLRAPSPLSPRNHRSLRGEGARSL